MDILDKISLGINQIFMWLAGIFLAAMILLTCANIFLRIVWVPVKGTYELMGFSGAMATAFVLGYTQIKKSHISVDIIVTRFSKKTQSVLNAINYFICLIFFSMAGWQIASWAATLKETGEVTETLRIVYYPFTYGVAIGCILISFVLLIELVKLLFPKNGVS